MQTKIKTPQRQWGKVFPPFVDAYHEGEGWTFLEFDQQMRKIAKEWSLEDCADIRRGFRPRMPSGKNITAIGWWGDARYVLLEEGMLIRHNWQTHWDVT